MPGIDREIAKHRIPTYPHISPIKQKKRRLRPEWALLVKKEVEKQLKAKFLGVIEDTQWLENVVPVLKKDGKVQICVDYRDLNKTCPKDDFSLPYIDTLVDSTASSAMYSFMDIFSGYNHIMIAVINKLKTSFTIEWGIYYYTVMSFGLKNAGVTY